MSPILIDTSVLLRLANAADPRHPLALQAIARLTARHHILCICPQVLIEFHSVATRPAAQQGIGLTSAQCQLHRTDFEQVFSMIQDDSHTFPAWKSLVDLGGVIGKQVHDARIVAICRVHFIVKLLTFDLSHITRLCGHVPGLKVLDPATV